MDAKLHRGQRRLALQLLACAVIGSGSANAAAQPAALEVAVIDGCHLWPYAQCPGVNLRGANLVGKDLRGVNFKGGQLQGADLRSANMAGAYLDGADLTDASLYALNAPGSSFKKARLIRVNGELARFFRADFSGALIEGGTLSMARLDYAQFVGTRISSCDLQEAKFNVSNLRDAEFSDNVIRFAIFPGAVMDGCRGCPSGW